MSFAKDCYKAELNIISYKYSILIIIAFALNYFYMFAYAHDFNTADSTTQMWLDILASMFTLLALIVTSYQLGEVRQIRRSLK